MIGNSLKVFLILSSICLVSCSLEGESIELNNPEKYILTKDLNWSSPDGFDLTLDIYQQVSERKFHPVLIIFHGGGWLVNNKSIMDQMSEYLASRRFLCQRMCSTTSLNSNCKEQSSLHAS